MVSIYDNLPFGSRLTKQRRIILDVLAQSQTHLSAREIFLLVKKKIANISYATIYRNLNFLVKNGLVMSLECSSKEELFEIAKDDHSHFICLRCRQVYDIDNAKSNHWRQPPFVLSGHKVVKQVFIYKGLCKKCKKLNRSKYAKKKK